MRKLTFRYFPQKLTPEQIELEKKIFKYSLFFPVVFLIVIWIIKLYEVVMGIELVQYGMYPREIKGLSGILFSPLLHGDWAHLLANSTSFIVLATALFFFYRKMAFRIFILNYLLSGILLWLAGRQVWHIGASGIVYGLAAFLFFSGVFRKDARLLTISLIVTFLYGSFIWGLFPIKEGVSWDGHLMGAASGTLLAIAFYKYGPPRQKFEWEDEDDDDEHDVQSDSLNDESIQTDTVKEEADKPQT